MDRDRHRVNAPGRSKVARTMIACLFNRQQRAPHAERVQLMAGASTRRSLVSRAAGVTVMEGGVGVPDGECRQSATGEGE